MLVMVLTGLVGGKGKPAGLAPPVLDLDGKTRLFDSLALLSILPVVRHVTLDTNRKRADRFRSLPSHQEEPGGRTRTNQLHLTRSWLYR
jgi:hypothetical protein